jgi:hypothetical protein
MREFIEYALWLCGKWHTNGLHSITREDMAELERLAIQAKMSGDEMAHAIVEFSDALEASDSDAANRRKLEALQLLKRKRAEILNDAESSIRIAEIRTTRSSANGRS